MPAEVQNSAIELLSKCVNAPSASCTFNGSVCRFKNTTASRADIEQACKDFGISHEIHLNNDVELSLDVPAAHGNVIVFFDEDDFLKRSLSYLPNFDQLTLVILKGDRPLVKEPNENFSSSKALLFNFFNYHNILTFLEKEEHFMSLSSRNDLQFIIFTSDKGPFYIGYDLHEPRVKNTEDLGTAYQLLKAEFQKIDFVQFFKAAIIQTIHSYEIKERFFQLVQSLRIILGIAQRDHYVYIRNFDFDKIKTKFKEERNKYFESLEKNIEAVSKQVTSFPLTFAASIFAGYQVKDKPAILVLVFLAYGLYTLIAWKILDITAFNTSNIKHDVAYEEEKIKTAYEVLHQEFVPDFTKINDKITRLESLIFLLRIVLFGLLLSFLFFGIYQTYFSVKSVTPPTEVRIVK